MSLCPGVHTCFANLSGPSEAPVRTLCLTLRYRGEHDAPLPRGAQLMGLVGAAIPPWRFAQALQPEARERLGAGVASTGNRLSLEGHRQCLPRRGEASWWKVYLGQGHLPALALGPSPTWQMPSATCSLPLVAERETSLETQRADGRLRVTQEELERAAPGQGKSEERGCRARKHLGGKLAQLEDWGGGSTWMTALLGGLKKPRQ